MSKREITFDDFEPAPEASQIRAWVRCTACGLLVRDGGFAKAGHIAWHIKQEPETEPERVKLTEIAQVFSGPGPVYVFPSPAELAEAIQSAERCPRFYGDDLHPEPCDGLEGCAECITLLADEIARLGHD